MREALCLMAVIVGGGLARGEKLLDRKNWATAVSLPAPAEILEAGAAAPFPCLKITGAAGRETKAAVAAFDSPGITALDYAVRGRIRGEGVEGAAYLEMWSHFAGGQQYFTRTLASYGPLKAISGNAAWRSFVLPFHLRQDSPKPERLVVNVIMPGAGTVYLGPMTLVEFAPGEDPLRDPTAWWDSIAGGLIGGLAGVILGLWGAVTGILAAKDKGKEFVRSSFPVVLAAGLLSLAAGAVALLRKQPYEVYYPLLLSGGLAAVLAAVLGRIVRRRCRTLSAKTELTNGPEKPSA